LTALGNGLIAKLEKIEALLLPEISQFSARQIFTANTKSAETKSNQQKFEALEATVFKQNEKLLQYLQIIEHLEKKLYDMDVKFERVTKNVAETSITFENKLNEEKKERKTQLTGFLGLLLSIK